MLEHYPVTYRDIIVGHLSFSNEGLYWRYEGTFQFDGNGIYRLCGITPYGQINLGVCRPMDGKWYIQGKIAAKKLDLGETSFTIHSDKSIVKVPLKENSAFAYLDLLDKCRISTGTDGIEIIIYAEK